MIKLDAERLMPIREVPAYLESRGFHRVHISAVYRWTQSGSRGVKLEAIRIGGQKVTSIEAIQRWVEACERVGKQADESVAVVSAEQERRSQQTREKLIEYRLEPTDLDVFFEGLKLKPETTCQHVAGVLFRAGLRNPEDIQKRTLEALLDLGGIGPKSEPIVRRLKLEADQM